MKIDDLETIERVLIITYTWKICTLIAGVIFMYFGYRLFMKGFNTGKLEIEAQEGERKVTLKHLAPGSFFALLGTVIICVVILDSFRYRDNITGIEVSEELNSDDFNGREYEAMEEDIDGAGEAIEEAY